MELLNRPFVSLHPPGISAPYQIGSYAVASAYHFPSPSPSVLPPTSPVVCWCHKSHTEALCPNQPLPPTSDEQSAYATASTAVAAASDDATATAEPDSGTAAVADASENGDGGDAAVEPAGEGEDGGDDDDEQDQAFGTKFVLSDEAKEMFAKSDERRALRKRKAAEAEAERLRLEPTPEQVAAADEAARVSKYGAVHAAHIASVEDSMTTKFLAAQRELKAKYYPAEPINRKAAVDAIQRAAATSTASAASNSTAAAAASDDLLGLSVVPPAGTSHPSYRGGGGGYRGRGGGGYRGGGGGGGRGGGYHKQSRFY